MKLLKRLSLALLLLAVVFAAVWPVVSLSLGAWGRELLSVRLSRVLHQSVVIDRLSVSLFPLAVQVEGVDLSHGRAVNRLGRVRVSLLPRTSIRQRRPVFDVVVDDLNAEPAALSFVNAKPSGDQAGSAVRSPLPSFRVRRFLVRNARVVLPYRDGRLEITLAEVSGHVEQGRSREGLGAGLRARAVRVRRGEAHFDMTHVRVRAGRRRSGWVLLEVDAAGKGLRVSGRRQGRGCRTLHRIRAEVEPRVLAVFEPVLARLAGTVRVEASVAGPLRRPEVTGELTATRLRYGQQTIGEVHGKLSYRKRTLAVDGLRLHVFGGEAHGDATLIFRRGLPMRVAARWEGIRVDALAATFGRSGLPAVTAGGQVQVTGALTPFAWEGSGDGRFEVAGSVPVTWHARGRRVRTGWQGDFGFRQTESNQAELRLELGKHRELGGSIHAALTGPALLARFAGVEAKTVRAGSLTARGRFFGTTRDPVVSGSVHGRDLSWRGVDVATLDAKLEARRRRVLLDEVRADLGGGSVRAQGVVALTRDAPNNWQAHLVRVPTDAVSAAARAAVGVRLPVSGGVLSASVQGTGPWSAPRINGDLKAEAFQLGGEPCQALSVQASFAGAEWQVDAVAVHRESEEMRLHAAGKRDKRLAVELQSSQWELGRLQWPGLPRLRGRFTVDAALEGPPRELTGRVRLGVEALNWAGRSVGKVHARADVNRGRWRVSGDLLDGAATFNGTVGQRAGVPVALAAAWRSVDLGRFLGVQAGGVRIPSTGQAQVRGSLAQWRRLSGELRVDDLVIRKSDHDLTLRQPLRVTLDSGSFRIAPAVMEGGDGTFRVDGGGNLDGALRMSLDANGTLGLVEIFSDRVQSASGTFRAALLADRVAGEDLRLTGQAWIRHAALDVGLPLVFTDTDARLTFEDQVVRIESLRGQAGGGTFALAGSLSPAEGLELTWRINDLAAAFVDGLEQELRGRGSLKGSWDNLTVDGTVRVVRALYDRQINLGDVLEWIRKKVARTTVVQERPDSTVHLHLRVVAPDELFVENNFARAELKALLQVTGTTAAPELSGTVEVLNGQVTFRDRVFELSTGIVEFRPEFGMDAVLNIGAETIVPTSDATYTVMVHVVGRSSEPRVLLSSDDPALSRTDLVSLITFGKTTAQLQQGGKGISAVDLLAAGAGLYRKDVEKGLSEILPLVDRVTIDPSFSRTTGAFEPRVSIAKDFTEDLTSRLSSTFGVESRRSLELEYRILPDTSLIGSWESETRDRAGAFGGQVKFRHTFRRLPHLSLLSSLWKRDAGEDE